jgi:hypothetical protein
MTHRNNPEACIQGSDEWRSLAKSATIQTNPKDQKTPKAGLFPILYYTSTKPQQQQHLLQNNRPSHRVLCPRLFVSA